MRDAASRKRQLAELGWTKTNQGRSCRHWEQLLSLLREPWLQALPNQTRAWRCDSRWGGRSFGELRGHHGEQCQPLGQGSSRGMGTQGRMGLCGPGSIASVDKTLL